MSDLALSFDPVTLLGDLTVDGNDLDLDDGLETAVIRSLFEDRRAEAGDVLPEGETDRRGWWGDVFPIVDGDRAGSRLWLLDRAKQTAETLRRAEEYVREALQWLLDDKVAERVEVPILEFPSPGRIDLAVEIYRPKGDSVTFRFHHTWAAQAGEI